jgi:hypothetical protein
MPAVVTVVPEVYKMYSGSVAATGTQPTGSAAATCSAQSRSRPATSRATACGRCSTTHQRGRCADSPTARSKIGLYSTTRLPSIPHDADTTTTGRASSIRVASSAAANPPNTTECTAPIRAHASIATTASGTIGI